jgi:hypothetical protein
LVASPKIYRSAFRSREVVRTVRRPTIGTGPFIMTTFLGFDHRLVLDDVNQCYRSTALPGMNPIHREKC